MLDSNFTDYFTDFSDPDQQESLLEFLEETKRIGDLKEKRDLLEYLSAVLSREGENIESKSPEFYEKLQSGWLALAFGSFPILSDDDRDSLLQKKIFTAIQKGFNPDQIIKEYFLIYESDEFLQNLFKHLKEVLDANTESLGSLPIEVEGKRMLPTIKYWLLDYSKFPSKVAKRGSVERLNYLTQSANVRQLTQGQRQNLSKLMKFYDDLIAAERPLNLQNRSSEDITFATRPGGPIPERPINIDEKLNELKERVEQ